MKNNNNSSMLNKKSSEGIKYIDLKNNGRIFPLWIINNFKKYKLPGIIVKNNEDPCNIEIKLELRKYQEFIGKYIGDILPYNEILLYHGLGSGKTATSINLMNVLYNRDHSYNFIILIKASLRDDPWMKDLRVWLEIDSKDNKDNVLSSERFKNIFFVHYDSPHAEKSFMEVIKKIDTNKPTLYLIDEVHNFIRNVYSNINSGKGKRAQVIYEYIYKEKKDNKNTKIILISATPGVNSPFELSLMFNLLRPGILPTSESEFNKMFITDSSYPILNPLRRNLFERRILGLVSYYIGATPDLYARQELKNVNLTMSKYQYNIYQEFQKLESEIERKSKRYGKGKNSKQSLLYKTYTRQACNYVFPNVNMNIYGENRPRPRKFKVDDFVIDNIEKGKSLKHTKMSDQEKEMITRYLKAIDSFLKETEIFYRQINLEDLKKGRSIFDDLADFKNGYVEIYKEKFVDFYNSDTQKSKLFETLYECSPKMLAIAFTSFVSPGKVMIYSNYVIMEGIDMLKIYLKLIGFDNYTLSKENMGFCEYHGRIDSLERVKIKDMFNDKNNIKGNKCKIILLSPSATEGIQLLNVVQEHITEPYWNEVRIRQVIGRGVRQCSHRDLPMEERVVKIFRYKMKKPDILDSDDTIPQTTDEHIEDVAKARDNLIESFLSAMKESAVDCELFRSHNMMSQSYQCFKFPEKTLFENNIGPAYKEDIKDDLKYDSGLHAYNSKIERIKVIKINAVIGDSDSGTYSDKNIYWYHKQSGMVYDYEIHFPIGKIETTNGLPNKLDKDTYIISVVIQVPIN
jgi:superfamily II DNA or RNA helicase